MAVDYNIYIHAVGGGSSQSNPTVPWSARENGGGDGQTTSQTGSSSGGVNGAGVARSIIKASSYMQNPDSAISQAFSSIAKAFPIVAAAYAVVKLGVSIADNVIEFGELETGDYRTGIQWQNLKRGTQIVFHPISSTVEYFKNQQAIKRDNKRLQAERDLLGDSVINSYTNRGV